MKKLTLAICLSLLLFGDVSSQENGAADREEAFRRIVQSYVQSGKGEYNKGYYGQALKTFVMAQGYQEYLTTTGREELCAHLEKARAAVAKRKLALEKFQAADKLIKQNQLIEAKVNLESLRKNEYLTKDWQTQIATVLKQIELLLTNDKASPQITAEKPEKIKEEITKTGEQQKGQNQEIPELYRSSMRFCRNGQFEKAREGFIKVVSSDLVPPPMKRAIERYLAEIEKKSYQVKIEQVGGEPMKRKEQQRVLRRSLRELLAKPKLAFRDMKPSNIPETAGVYMISVRNKPYYVGRSKNLRQRLYNNHLMGPLTNARLKKYLIGSCECKDKQAAKQFIRERAVVQWLEVKDLRPRAFLECYATAFLQPKYGISEEH